ncbi:MAG: transporter permease [Paenibacillaceae bacterium]|jgi:ABC-2 type transport system permease protein|nr:transporter permease [Paenibacillaceae bacterium]
MWTVFLAQWMKEKRSPFMVLIFCGISILATLMFGSNMNSQMKIGVFPAEGVTREESAGWLKRLNENGSFHFQLQDEEQALADVRQGRSAVAVRLLRDDYRLISAMENINVDFVRQHVQTVYTEEFTVRAAVSHADQETLFRERMALFLEQPPLAVQTSTPSGGELKSYDMGLQLLFGFSLFLVIFTVGFKVNAVTAEKVSGIWNRVILSPVTKLQMYMGHLIYSSLIGIFQLAVIFTIFRYGFGYHLGGSLGMLAVIIGAYIMAIVAMSMLFTGLLNTPEQFAAIFTSVVPIMPLVSGIYMPPGTITNSFLLFLGQLLPLQHAMDALIGTAVYQQGWTDIWLPMAKLLLMSVIFFGIGVNLVERRKG